MTFQLTIYTKKTAPHLGMRGGYRSQNYYIGEEVPPSECERCQEHLADPEKTSMCYTHGCGNCMWSQRSKFRAKRLRALRKINKQIEQGKLPEMPKPFKIPRTPKGFNPAAVVLPTFPKWSLEKLQRQCVSIVRPRRELVGEYLRLTGRRFRRRTVQEEQRTYYASIPTRPVEVSYKVWDCGCQTERDYASAEKLCEKHQPLLVEGSY